MSLFLPQFLQQLQDPAIKTVLLCGTGGGFDFVHALLLIPELVRLEKSFLIHSYSFGSVHDIDGPIFWRFCEKRDSDSVNGFGQSIFSPMSVKKVTASSKGSRNYQPEIGVASFLDQEFPANAPHVIYASNAREWTIKGLQKLLNHLVELHQVDAIVAFDGGSDSLMCGDEAGLGDPIEDAVTVGAVHMLQAERVKVRLLVTVGLGCDRFNSVSDAASFRAIAELTGAGAFRGSLSIDAAQEPFKWYRRALDHIYTMQSFRSVLSGALSAAAQGMYGLDVPEELRGRVRSNRLFLWPLMATLWAFDPAGVVERSLVIPWIAGADSAAESQHLLARGRAELLDADLLLPIENLPTQESILTGVDIPTGHPSVALMLKKKKKKEEKKKQLYDGVQSERDSLR